MSAFPIMERPADAQSWLDRYAVERPVEAAWGRIILGTGSHDEVLEALARYQNDDGGFSNGLEPDISAPQSNPFAARLALEVIHATGIPAHHTTVTQLVSWLEQSQDEDGCWRFADGTMDHPIAPWFRGWTFPALNPAIDLSEWLTRLGLGSPRLHDRCQDLYTRLARPEEIESGAFYDVLPYAEYLPWRTDLPDHETWMRLLSENIRRGLESGTYETPQQAAEHIGPPDGPIAQLLPRHLLAALLPRLLEQQQPDGHWATPYDSHWNPYQTVGGMLILASYPTA